MENKLMNFFDALEKYGEDFFSSGSMKEDYELITNVLKAQGFWSGVYYRLYFDNDFNLTSVQEKRYN